MNKLTRDKRLMILSILVEGTVKKLRSAGTAFEFIHDLKDRLASRVQLTTDGHRAYLEAVESAFGGDIDYAMLVKIYGEATEEDRRRYSPGKCLATDKRRMLRFCRSM